MGELLNINRDIVDAAEAAYQRTKPLIEKASNNMRELAFKIREEWERLKNEEERQSYADKLGWSYKQVQNVARIKKEEYLEKEQLIIDSLDPSARRPDLEGLGIRHMQEISRTSKSLLKKAAKAGLFDEKAPTTRQLEKLRKTGTTKAVPTKAKTELQKAKDKITDATKHMKKAKSRVSDVSRWMKKNDIESIRGPQVMAFFNALQDLNAQIAALDPEKAAAARKILIEGNYE